MISVILCKVSQPSLQKRKSYEGKFVTVKCSNISDGATLKRPPFILLKGQLRELTQQLESVHEQLIQKDGQLREVTKQLTNVQGQLQKRDGELRQMTQQFTNVEGQLQVRDGELRQMTQHGSQMFKGNFR